MSLNADRRSSTSSSTPRAVVTPDLRGVRSDIGAFFQNQLRALGPDFATTPQGFIGQAYRGLFDKDPTTDVLGAANAIQSVLGGGAFSQAFDRAMGILEPSVQNQIRQLNTSVLNQSSPLGLRFSSDVLNQQRRGAEELLLGAQNQAANLANQFASQQLQGGLSVFGLTQQAALDQLARQLPLLIQYATSFAPVGQNATSSASGSGFGFGLPIAPVKVGG